jgi:hypothetical protein
MLQKTEELKGVPDILPAGKKLYWSIIEYGEKINEND